MDYNIPWTIMQHLNHNRNDSQELDLKMCYERHCNNWPKREAITLGKYRFKKHPYYETYEDYKEAVKLETEYEYSLGDFEVVDDMLKPRQLQCVVSFTTKGKIIFGDSLDILETFQKDFNINSKYGKLLCTEHYAKENIAHGFVGNSCPRLYYSKLHEEIIIGSIGYDEETEEAILPDKSYEKLGAICTDLWWYTIVDAEQYPEEDGDVAEIAAGTWKLEHYYGIKSYEEHPYARLKLIT